MNDTPRTPVWRTVFPLDDVEAVRALYIDGDASAATIAGRRSVRVRPGGSISLGSYFNAFPAASWRAETDIDVVRLDVHAHGRGAVLVYASDAAASARLVGRHEIDGATVVAHDIALAEFGDGGALWIDLEAAGDHALELDGAEWSIARTLEGTATVAMATFNRPRDCVAQLRTLACDDDVRAVIDRVVVVDQGTDLVEREDGFGEAAEALGERLVLIRQQNLGGSGGFSRGMREALRHGDSDYVLLLDDDAISEPEAIVRAVRFADAGRAPRIVGGGMLHIDDRAVLYAQSEQWDHRIGWVRLNREGAYDHDFARAGFRQTAFFHARQHSDFNGWWMCLIPLSLLRDAGLALPVFLKGDDIEFALRAREHGVSTVSVPGIALWHLGWGGKAPTRTWEAYFLHRNRLITELLHSPYRRPTGLVLHALLGDLKPLLTLQYSAVRLRAQAVADVLAGPDELPGWLATRAGAIRALWQEYPDAVPVDAAVLPSAAAAAPRGRLHAATVLSRTVWRHLLVSAKTAGAPPVHVPADSLGWWTFATVDSALVDTADGAARVRYRRSRRETRRALWRSIRLYARLWATWPRLARRFRRRAPGLASTTEWNEVFGA